MYFLEKYYDILHLLVMLAHCNKSRDNKSRERYQMSESGICHKVHCIKMNPLNN